MRGKPINQASDAMPVSPAKMVPERGWRGPAAARLSPLPTSRITWLQRRVVNYIARREQVPARNLFRSLLHAPRLFYGWLAFAGAMMPYGALSRRQTEIVILRTAWYCRCRYEWMQHVEIGRRAGLDNDEIRRVTLGPGAAGWTPLEADLLNAVDEQLGEGVIDQSTWASLARTLSPRQQVELTMLIGHYRMLADVIDNLGVQVER